MTIRVFSKKNWGICEAAKEKLKVMGFEYEEHDLTYHVELHDGWRNDDSADVMAAYSMYDTMPLIQLENEFHDYPGAMRQLKRISARRKKMRLAAAGEGRGAPAESLSA